jgi:hypothetical protein
VQLANLKNSRINKFNKKYLTRCLVLLLLRRRRRKLLQFALTRRVLIRVNFFMAQRLLNSFCRAYLSDNKRDQIFVRYLTMTAGRNRNGCGHWFFKEENLSGGDVGRIAAYERNNSCGRLSDREN